MHASSQGVGFECGEGFETSRLVVVAVSIRAVIRCIDAGGK
jgi:hypothetical protein